MISDKLIKITNVINNYKQPKINFISKYKSLKKLALS